MRLRTDQPEEFWSQVWACRGAVSQAAQVHQVDTQLLDDRVVCELVGYSFLLYAKALTSWRWSVVLLFCNYVLELVLRLQWQQAIQLLSGLLAEESLWKSLELDATEKTVCLQSLLDVFKQLPAQLSSDEVNTLTYDVNYWRPAFEVVHDSVKDCYTYEFRHRWYRRVWVRDEDRYLARITQEIAYHDQHANQRWGWWHRLVGWWKNIDEKQRLLQLKQLQRVLAGWSLRDVLPTSEEIDEQLILGCELKISTKLKELQRLSLQQHERRGADMVRELRVAGQEPATQDYDGEIVNRLAVFQEALEQKGCAVVTLYFEALMQGEVKDLSEVLPPIITMGKLYQTQLSRLMIDQGVPPAERNGYRERLALCQNGVQKVLLQLVDRFSLNVRRLYAVRDSLILPQQASSSGLVELLQHYSRITSFEEQARWLYEEPLSEFDAQTRELNTVVKDKLFEAYTLVYQRLKESYWEELERYENNLVDHLQLFCTEHEGQLLRMVREEQARARNAEPVQEVEVSLQIQGRFLEQLSEVSSFLSDIQPKFARLAEAKRDLITYQRHCQVSLIGLQPQLVRLGQCERALSLYRLDNQRALKVISKTKVPILSAVEEFCKTVSYPRQPREVLVQALLVVEQHWEAFARAHEQWNQLALPIRMRLSCEVKFRSEFTHDTIKDADEVWLHYSRPRNHFLLAYDDTKQIWSVLGRDSQGQVHRFDLNLQAGPWKLYKKILAYFEEGKARYSSEYYEQVLCYPLLKRLAQELGEPLFEFSDAADQVAYYPPHLAAYLQKEFSRLYEKQVLSTLARLYQAKSQLRRARTLLAYLNEDGKDNDPIIARSWEQLSRSMLASTLPEFPSNPCRELVPYSPPSSELRIKLENYALLTPDEKRYEDFHRVVFDYLQLFCRFEYDLVKVIRAHQSESIAQWHEGVRQNQQLNADWEQLNRQYKQVWRISHPDKIQSELADIHPKARSSFLGMVHEYRKDIKLKNDLIRGIFENGKGFEAYLRKRYILGMGQGDCTVRGCIDYAIYYQQRDWQHYALGMNLKFFKKCFETAQQYRQEAEQYRQEAEQYHQEAEQERQAREKETARAERERQAREQERQGRERAEARVRELEAKLRAAEGAASSGPKLFA